MRSCHKIGSAHNYPESQELLDQLGYSTPVCLVDRICSRKAGRCVARAPGQLTVPLAKARKAPKVAQKEPTDLVAPSRGPPAPGALILTLHYVALGRQRVPKASPPTLKLVRAVSNDQKHSERYRYRALT